MNNIELYEHLVRIFYNSFLVFVFTVLIVEGSLYLLKIRNARVRSIMRCLPILKLPLDLFIYKLISWDGFAHFYIFGCKGLLKQVLFIVFPSFFSIDLYSNTFPSISKSIVSQVPTPWIFVFFICLLFISFILVCHKIYLICHSLRYLRRIKQFSKKCLRPISNLTLLAHLSKRKTQILQSSKIDVPFASQNAIFLPKKMVYKLTQGEFEAVIAHELEHIKWKDHWIRLLCEMILSFFWWLPKSWLIRKIEEEQEQACDACIKRYFIHSDVLMNAIYKVTKQQKNENIPYAFCGFIQESSLCFKRFNKILENNEKGFQSSFSVNLILIIISAGIIGMRFYLC